MAKKKTEEKPEEKVSMYDPTVDAYREIPVSLAEKFIESAKEIEKKLKTKEEENE
jgi:hypothetical protein